MENLTYTSSVGPRDQKKKRNKGTLQKYYASIMSAVL